MKKLITTMVMIITITTLSIGQCNSLFSVSAHFNTVTFLNQSTVSNAHYFWNFGDGTGSNFVNPVHTFPGTGEYLVTLFAKDTISNCSAYYEYWVDVIKYSNDSCQPSISDSIFNYLGNEYINVFNTSANCNGYNFLYSVGTSANFSYPVFLWTVPFHMVCIGNYTIGANIMESAYKTAYYNYSSSHNYGDCSANFEFIVVSKSSMDERILFTAMNKNALHYEWYIDDFGNPIISNYDTVSQLYPLNTPGIWDIGLITQDSNGCRDSIYQNILTGDSTMTVLGTNNIKESEGTIAAYPNPNNGQFTFDFNTRVNGTIEIYDITGQRIYQQTVESERTEINLSGEPNGMYFYRAITYTGSLIGEGKIAIEK